ncbi:hypothetical protein Tco_1399991 [Tanacetum coccineum]
MSSPNHSTSDLEDAFSSMNILNYTSVSSDYFPASSGSSSFNSSENSKDNMISPVFSSFYNNPCLKDLQAIYTKELPISSPDPITPRYFFISEELLPPKKQIYSSSSSSIALSNSSRNQTCNLVSPSSLVYTPTPHQVLDIQKCSIKIHLKHHEEQVEDILNNLDELSFHRIEKMEEGRINGVESFEEVDISFLSIKVVKVCLIKDMGCMLWHEVDPRMANILAKEMIGLSFPSMMESKHDGRACIYGDFVSVNTNDILTNDEFPILDVGRKIISEDNGGI